MKTIRAIAGLMLAFLCCSATATDLPKMDGVWLKDGIEAYDRLMGQRGTGDDMANGILMSGWLRGVIAAQQHSSSNLTFRMMLFANVYRDLKQKGDEKNAEIARNLYKDAQTYAPKFDVPAGVTMDQIAAVVLKYLTNHPEKWQYSAVGLTNEALAEAFPQRLPIQELK